MRAIRNTVIIRQKTGFSLIEIMVALAVLSISLVVLLGLRNRGISLAQHARQTIEATLLAQQKVTEISISGYANLGEQEGDFGEDYPQYKWKQLVTQTPFDAVRELSVQVSWQNQEHPERMDITTYLFDRAPAPKVKNVTSRARSN